MDNKIIYSDEHRIHVYNNKNISFDIQSKHLKQICSNENYIILLYDNNKIMIFDINTYISNILQYDINIKQICLGKTELLILFENGGLYIIYDINNQKSTYEYILKKYSNINYVYKYTNNYNKNYYIITTNKSIKLISINIDKLPDENNNYSINIIKYKENNCGIDIFHDIFYMPSKIKIIASSPTRHVLYCENNTLYEKTIDNPGYFVLFKYKIKKIVCGINYSIFLSERGELYKLNNRHLELLISSNNINNCWLLDDTRMSGLHLMVNFIKNQNYYFKIIG